MSDSAYDFTEMNRRVLDSLVDLLLITDRRGKIVRVSPSVYSILGYHATEMEGRSAIEFIYQGDLDATRIEMRRVRRGGITRHFECRYVHRNGTPINLLWSGVWLEDVRVFVFIGRDVTEIKEAERWNALGESLRHIDHRLGRTNAILLAIDRDVSPFEILLTINSFWAARVLMTRSALFETYPQTFHLASVIALDEKSWALFAIAAAMVKVAGLALNLISSRWREVGHGIRTLGLGMSGVFWFTMGVSAISNPDSLFGFGGGIVLAFFAWWTAYRLNT